MECDSMKCRICNTEISTPFLSLGNLPLVNSFVEEKNLYEKEEYYPLDIYVCGNCKLVQANDYVSSNLIFNTNYVYFSSFSKIWNKHCEDYVNMIIGKLNLNANSRIIEIGSNDGTLLKNFISKNILNVIGVDPAEDAAIEAIKKGVNTHIFMFNDHYVKNMLSPNSVDLVIGNNVLAHNTNLNELVRSMKYILKSDGVITIEFPHLLNIVKYNQFDTMYHEHFSYFSLYSAKKLFEINNLEIYDVEEIPTHGGSLRLYIRHKNKNTDMSNSVYSILRKEIGYGLHEISTYDKFAKNVSKMKKDILSFMLKISDKKIACYGAAAKGNTLLNYCGLGKDFIEYTVDLNPHKQGLYLPGNHIPTYHPDMIMETKPDYIIIIPWNIKNEIIKQLEYTKEWGCKLVTLIPEVEIYD